MNEFLLMDRLQKIRQIVNKYGEELDTLEKYFPNERKQCEIIWKPVYDEYRRIGYRLKPIEAESEE